MSIMFEYNGEKSDLEMVYSVLILSTYLQNQEWANLFWSIKVAKIHSQHFIVSYSVDCLTHDHIDHSVTVPW